MKAGYVALADSPLDYSSVRERELIESRLGFADDQLQAARFAREAARQWKLEMGWALASVTEDSWSGKQDGDSWKAHTDGPVPLLIAGGGVAGLPVPAHDPVPVELVMGKRGRR